MRRLPAALLAVGALAGAAVAGDAVPRSDDGSASASSVRPATPVGVSAREWRLSAYRESVRRGRVSFNVHNYGEDAHNLQIGGPRGYRSRITPDIEPGANARLVATLARKGTYSLLCVKPGHLAKGMRSSIRVR